MKERLNDIDLYLETRGHAGPSIVLVHGSWGDHHNWDIVGPQLAKSARVTTYDRRGHSQSQRPAGQGSIRDDVRDLTALIEWLGTAPVHVVGSSFGAIVTLGLLVARPDLVASAAIHEPPLIGLLDADPMLDVVQQRLGAVLQTLSSGDSEGGARQFVETVAFGPGMWEQLPPAMRDTFIFNAPTFVDEMNEREAFTFDLKALATYGGPLLMTQGDQSPPFFRQILDRLEDVLPRAQRQTFRGAGHAPHLTHPDDYALVIGSFVAGVHVL